MYIYIYIYIIAIPATELRNDNEDAERNYLLNTACKEWS